MYNNVNDNWLQYIFEWDPTKTTKQSYLAVGISTNKKYEA